MASFKISKKDHLSDARTTLEDLHEKKMKHFELEKNKLPELQKQLDSLKQQYNNSKNNQEKAIIYQDIKKLEDRIESIIHDYSQTEYLLKFAKIISKSNETEQYSSSPPKKGVLDNFIQSKINNNKIELYNEYIKNFNPEIKEIYIPNEYKNSCTYCKKDTLIIDTRQSCEICVCCGRSQTLLDLPQGTTPVYIEDIEQANSFFYKRKNHFLECLNQLQAKENTNIPKQIIESLSQEFKKYNITDPKLLTPKLVKGYLKKLNFNKYYEHIPIIINEFCGIPAPRMSKELEEQLRIMFDEIQEPFEKWSAIISPNRKNCLNYNYIFYKMCELLNRDEFLVLFPLLKNREKLYEHDKIWKGICSELKWEFIPSI
jgi:hypothetical protein